MLNLLPRDGELYYLPEFLPPEEAVDLFLRFRDGMPWRDQILTDAGAPVCLPRAVCWYGDSGADYPYAGFTHRPLPWTAPLRDLKGRVETACGAVFHGVLCNLYRTGADAMGWHADREPILGEAPLIASLSLGAARIMAFRHEAGGEGFELRLAPGSLLVMAGALQRHWLHAIPPGPDCETARVNLNFRRLRLPSASG